MLLQQHVRELIDPLEVSLVETGLVFKLLGSDPIEHIREVLLLESSPDLINVHAQLQESLFGVFHELDVWIVQVRVQVNQFDREVPDRVLWPYLLLVLVQVRVLELRDHPTDLLELLR